MTTLLRMMHFDAAAPKWNKIFKAGEYHRRDMPGGKIVVGRAEFEEMIRNWKAMGGNGLPVDRHHWGDSNDTSVRADDKVAVGFIEDLRVDADGDLEGLTKWNALGFKLLSEDLMRYFSPTFHPSAINRRTGKKQGWTIAGGALLNDPFISDLPRLAASEHPSASSTSPGAVKMNKLLLAALSAALNIKFAEDASEADVIKAVEAAGADRKKLADELEAATKMSATQKDSNETLKKALAVEVEAREALAKKVDEVLKLNEGAKVDAAISELRRKGKVTPAEVADAKKIALALGVDECKRIYSARPTVVPPAGEIGVPGDVDSPAGEDEMTPAEASKKLDEITAGFVKAGMNEGDAYMRAIDENNALAFRAQMDTDSARPIALRKTA